MFAAKNTKIRVGFQALLDGFSEVGAHPLSFLLVHATLTTWSMCHGARRDQRLHRTVHAVSLRAAEQEARGKTRGQTRKVNYSGKNGHFVQSNILFTVVDVPAH